MSKPGPKIKRNVDRMNKRLAAGSGIGLVVGAVLGIVVDPLFGAKGVAMILGAALGISLGAGIALSTSKKD